MNIKIETFHVNLVAEPDVIYVINTNFISNTKIKEKKFYLYMSWFSTSDRTKFKTNRRSIQALGSQISKIIVLVTDEYIKQKNKNRFYK